MLRIPNPGSDIDQFIRTFRAIHPRLVDLPEFGLDDMGRAMVDTNTVSSQGAIGAQALLRSTRADRSRDPIYNQAKMYSELYRTLGWMASASQALRFRFTHLGNHLASAADPRALTRESFLAMAFPNPGSNVRGEQVVRPFSTILKVLARLDALSRDELIAGPMCIEDDSSPELIAALATDVERMRRVSGALDRHLDRIAAQRGIKRHPTMGNYVRIPMAVPPWAGWTERAARGQLRITDFGRKEAARLEKFLDFRAPHFERLPTELRPALIRATHLRMLERSGFDLEDDLTYAQAAEQLLRDAGLVKPIHFSPFQQLSIATIEQYAPEFTAYHKRPKDAPTIARKISEKSEQVSRLTRLLVQTTAGAVLPNARTAAVEVELCNALNAVDGLVEKAVQRLHLVHGQDQKDAFYPLVADLLTIAGFNCEVNRIGVNNAREDALIVHAAHSIPVEIKSPSEEIEISVKGVRQALENKIILLAREGIPHATTRATTTLVVGYNPPNARSEVHELVDDIFATYRINIGVVDFASLLRLALTRVKAQAPLELAQMFELRGMLDVQTA